jgi:hypothetical protein
MRRGFAGAAARVSAPRSWLRDPQRARLAKRVDDELAGRSVRRAQSMLLEIAEFERE